MPSERQSARSEDIFSHRNLEKGTVCDVNLSMGEAKYLVRHPLMHGIVSHSQYHLIQDVNSCELEKS